MWAFFCGMTYSMAVGEVFAFIRPDKTIVATKLDDGRLSIMTIPPFRPDQYGGLGIDHIWIDEAVQNG